MPTPTTLLWHTLEPQNTLSQLESSERGLSSAQASERLQQYGPNQLQATPPIPKWRKFLAQFTNPLVLLLLVAVVISLIFLSPKYGRR